MVGPHPSGGASVDFYTQVSGGQLQSGGLKDDFDRQITLVLLTLETTCRLSSWVSQQL